MLIAQGKHALKPILISLLISLWLSNHGQVKPQSRLLISTGVCIFGASIYAAMLLITTTKTGEILTLAVNLDRLITPMLISGLCLLGAIGESYGVLTKFILTNLFLALVNFMCYIISLVHNRQTESSDVNSIQCTLLYGQAIFLVSTDKLVIKML